VFLLSANIKATIQNTCWPEIAWEFLYPVFDRSYIINKTKQKSFRWQTTTRKDVNDGLLFNVRLFLFFLFVLERN